MDHFRASGRPSVELGGQPGPNDPPKPTPGPTRPPPPVGDPIDEPSEEPPPVEEPQVDDPAPSPDTPPMVAAGR